MSFHEISIAVRAENRASAALRSVALDVANLGAYFGILSNEQVKAVSVMFTVIRVMGSLRAIAQSGAVAQKVYAAATWIATAAQNALNISYATFLALTGVGIAVIIAAAATMAHFASQMNAATASVKDYNAAMAETLGYSRSIRRAGEEEYYRRGIED